MLKWDVSAISPGVPSFGSSESCLRIFSLFRFPRNTSGGSPQAIARQKVRPIDSGRADIVNVSLHRHVAIREPPAQEDSPLNHSPE